MFEGFTIPGLLLAGAFGVFIGLLYSKTRLKNAADLLQQAADQSKKHSEQIQQFLVEIGKKDVLIERSANLLDSGTQKMQELTNALQVVERDRELLKSTVEFQKTQYEKLLGQKKSSETRLGFVAEQMAPFLDDYPLPPETGKFLGQPIDLVHFLEDKIVFVEIKSGKSSLSKKQRDIRDQIKEGKVEFIVHRVEGTDGTDSGQL